MLWIFAATMGELRAALPTWVPALLNPEARELTNPFTGRRVIESTYNPTPNAHFDSPPEEQPPPFSHAHVWEPEPRVGWLALYEAVTGSHFDLHQELFGASSSSAILCREVLCGRPGGPTVRAVPEDLRELLLSMKETAISELARRWTQRAQGRLANHAELRHIDAATSLKEIISLAQTPAARSARWFSWEDTFDW